MDDQLRVQQEAEDLSGLISRVGVSSIIDVHTHFMPRPVMDKVWSYFDAAGPLTGKHWPIMYRFEEHERLATLRSFGVEHFSSLCYPHKPDMAEWLNEWAIEFAANTPGCLQSATFYPEPVATEYVTRAIDAGAQVFKSHLQVGDYAADNPLLDGVWDVLQESGVPVVIHAGNGPVPGRFTGPEGVGRLLQRYPRLTLIVAHMGLPNYAEFFDLCERYENVYLDTTMAFTRFTEEENPFDPAHKPRLTALGDRVLFGSDFPNIPYSYFEAVDAIVRLGLGSEWVRGVLHDNAARLFSLSA